MKQVLIQAAREIGFSDIGFAKAEVYEDLRKQLLARGCVFAGTDIERRVNPFLILPGAKSVIVLLCSYYTGLRGNISAYAFGQDYHRVLTEKCRALASFLEKAGYAAQVFCDTGDLCERDLAWRAGLGFIGRSGFLISPKFGSYVFISHIVTDCPLPPDKPLAQTCAGCGQCARACPGGALSKDGIFIPERCLSYITQKKGQLTLEEERLIRESGCAWGCDVCQAVCPHNRGIPKTGIPEFSQDLITTLSIDPGISNREFKRKYGGRAFAWRGKNVLLRNLDILRKS